MSQRKEPWINGPAPKQEEILSKALQHIDSVPYKVSLRWVFYRLLQEGYYKDKDGYFRFEFLASRARHTAWGGWHPATLADETRAVIRKIHGYPSIEAANDFMVEEIRAAANVSIDHFYRQKNYIELWFEARAMAAQFEFYTDGIDLVPLGGQPSIALKWDLAKRLEAKAAQYEIPIVILYFGDADTAGQQIEDTVTEDVTKWCEAEFEVINCGLTSEQAAEYNVPESIEKKGFQWEALPDAAAEAIITQSIEKYIDTEEIENAESEAELLNEEWEEKIDELFKDF